jgi:hypothetical protein
LAERDVGTASGPLARDPELDVSQGRRKVQRSIWATAALTAVAVSAFGYILQLLLDFTSKVPAVVGAVFFFAVFGGGAIAALLLGIAALVVGRGRRAATTTAGLVAVGYVILMQTIQSVWD